MAPANEFAFEGNHHSIKVCLGGEVETYLDPKVPSSLAGGYPLEAFTSAPLPSPFLLTSPNGGGLVPIYLRSRCVTKGLENRLCLVHVGQGAL
jgi:hypothetical protein